MAQTGREEHRAIILMNLAHDLNSRRTLEDFYRQFGPVEKITCSKRNSNAIIQFVTHEAAVAAKENEKPIAPGYDLPQVYFTRNKLVRSPKSPVAARRSDNRFTYTSPIQKGGKVPETARNPAGVFSATMSTIKSARPGQSTRPGGPSPPKFRSSQFVPPSRLYADRKVASLRASVHKPASPSPFRYRPFVYKLDRRKGRSGSVKSEDMEEAAKKEFEAKIDEILSAPEADMEDDDRDEDEGMIESDLWEELDPDEQHSMVETSQPNISFGGAEKESTFRSKLDLLKTPSLFEPQLAPLTVTSSSFLPPAVATSSFSFSLRSTSPVASTSTVTPVTTSVVPTLIVPKLTITKVSSQSQPEHSDPRRPFSLNRVGPSLFSTATASLPRLSTSTSAEKTRDSSPVRSKPLDVSVKPIAPVKKTDARGKSASTSSAPLDLFTFHRDVPEGQPLFNKKVFGAEERYRVLDSRDKIIRARNPKVKVSVEFARKLYATCLDMCPEKERYMREFQRQLTHYETLPGKDSEVDHKKAIKGYSRSSADQDEPLPHELRPASVLAMTMDYLLINIVPRGDLETENLGDWYTFVWDRTRSIRKDITQQQLCDHTAVSLMEKCARFHIHCASRLVELDRHAFEPKLNDENLMKCLQSLEHLYEDLRKKGITCPNEPEFRSYEILMKLNEGDILWEIQQKPREMFWASEIQLALKLLKSYSERNYASFFRLVKTAPYMTSCILHRYFYQVRTRALTSIIRSHTTQVTSRKLDTTIPVPVIRSLLGFSAAQFNLFRTFCMEHGTTLDSTQQNVILSRKHFMRPEYPLNFREYDLIESKLGVPIAEAINFGPLGPNPYDYHTPHSSFDANGCLIPGNVSGPPPAGIVLKPPTSAKEIFPEPPKHATFSFSLPKPKPKLQTTEIPKIPEIKITPPDTPAIPPISVSMSIFGAPTANVTTVTSPSIFVSKRMTTTDSGAGKFIFGAGSASGLQNPFASSNVFQSSNVFGGGSSGLPASSAMIKLPIVGFPISPPADEDKKRLEAEREKQRLQAELEAKRKQEKAKQEAAIKRAKKINEGCRYAINQSIESVVTQIVTRETLKQIHVFTKIKLRSKMVEQRLEMELTTELILAKFREVIAEERHKRFLCIKKAAEYSARIQQRHWLNVWRKIVYQRKKDAEERERQRLEVIWNFPPTNASFSSAEEQLAKWCGTSPLHQVHNPPLSKFEGMTSQSKFQEMAIRKRKSEPVDMRSRLEHCMQYVEKLIDEGHRQELASFTVMNPFCAANETLKRWCGTREEQPSPLQSIPIMNYSTTSLSPQPPSPLLERSFPESLTPILNRKTLKRRQLYQDFPFHSTPKNFKAHAIGSCSDGPRSSSAHSADQLLQEINSFRSELVDLKKSWNENTFLNDITLGMDKSSERTFDEDEMFDPEHSIFGDIGKEVDSDSEPLMQGPLTSLQREITKFSHQLNVEKKAWTHLSPDNV